MADPTIQTFCCHRGNGSDMALLVMKVLDTDKYNTVCIISSVLGVLGALYQILPRDQYVHHHQLISITAQRGRNIIVWLATADLLASFGVLIRSCLWLRYKNIMPSYGDNSSVLFCAICSAIAQYFYMATWIWTLCYAVDMKLLLTEKKTRIKQYHLAAWTLPAVLTSIGLSLLYLPNGECHSFYGRSAAYKVLPNYIATYGPIATVMFINPILYVSSTKDMEEMVITISGQYTSKEREVVVAFKRKILFINLAFFVCWMPNLINGILVWAVWTRLPAKLVVTLWYIMATVNPLQALFNSIVYRRWTEGAEKIIKPKIFKTFKFRSPIQMIRNSNLAESEGEIVPLLENLPRSSINGYSNGRDN